MYDEDFPRPDYKLTCEDFGWVGAECCPTCHDPDTSEYELRVVKVDGVNALLCCSLVAFFYPKEPGTGLSPEEKLLRAIFGERSSHPTAEKYMDPEILKPPGDFDD